MKYMAVDFADVGSVHMDADGGFIGQCVPHAVHIANGGRYGFDGACFKSALFTDGQPVALCVFGEGLAQLCAAQHADQTPHRVVVDGRGLTWAPHKAND